MTQSGPHIQTYLLYHIPQTYLKRILAIIEPPTSRSDAGCPPSQNVPDVEMLQGTATIPDFPEVGAAPTGAPGSLGGLPMSSEIYWSQDMGTRSEPSSLRSASMQPPLPACTRRACCKGLPEGLQPCGLGEPVLTGRKAPGVDYDRSQCDL